MSKSNKKAALLVIWLALLGGLLFGITHFGGTGTSPDSSSGQRKKPLLAPDAALVARRWPDIVAHAAAPPRGNPHAPYTLAEFGDFQCHPCYEARPLLEDLLVRYPHQVNMIFVHCPLPNVHKYALAAAEASNVASAEGKFWPMYDTLYQHQDDLEPGSYGGYAAQIGLNKAKFLAALLARQGKPGVDAAMHISSALGIVETPTVMVRDNIHGTLHIYIGISGEGNPPGMPGIRALSIHPPWLFSENLSHAPKRQ